VPPVTEQSCIGFTFAPSEAVKNFTAGALGVGAVSGLVPYDLASTDDDDEWEPVSFAEKTASGKIKLQIADLAKVGPEGYIHGYICVRPPCGPKYKEAVRESHGGKTVNPVTGHVLGRDLKKEPGDAGYRIKYHAPGAKKGEILNGQYASRQDAAKAAALTHNIDLLKKETIDGTTYDRLVKARTALIDGDHHEASVWLAGAQNAAYAADDGDLASHIEELHHAINSSSMPNPVTQPEAAPDQVPVEPPAPSHGVTPLIPPGAAEQPQAPAEPTPAPAVTKPKTLPKTKLAAVDEAIQRAAEDSLSTGMDAALAAARQRVKNGAYSMALENLKTAHQEAVEAHDDIVARDVAAAHDALADAVSSHLLLQPRTVSQASELTDQIYPAAAAAAHLIDTSERFKRLTDPSVLRSALRQGQAQSTIRLLRVLDLRLKKEQKHTWAPAAAQLGEAQKSLQAAMRTLEKLHDSDQSAKDFTARLNELMDDLKRINAYDAASYLEAAKRNYIQGNASSAQQSLKNAVKKLRSKHGYIERQSFAPDAQKLISALITNPPANALPGTLLVKPSKLAAGERPGELVPGRKNDTTMNSAEHFLATGERGTSEKVDTVKATEYKNDVAHRVADEMMGVRTSDLARMALGNNNIMRVPRALVEDIAANGTDNIRVNASQDPRSPQLYFQHVNIAGEKDQLFRALLARVNKSAAQIADAAALTPEARRSLMPSPELVNEFLPYSERTALYALAKSAQLWQVPNGGYYTVAAYNRHLLDPAEEAQAARTILQQLRDKITATLSKSTQPLTPEDERHLRAEMVSPLINLWAASSNDHHVASLAVQRAVAEEFGLQHKPWSAETGDIKKRVDQFVADHRTPLRRFVRAQYDLTQRELAAAGIKSVVLHRAMTWNTSGDVPEWAQDSERKSVYSAGIKPSGSVVAVKEDDWRPISSWSHRASEATKFYGKHSVRIQVRASVPAEKVFATPRTGVGCLSEREWIVLAAPAEVVIGRSAEYK
jgi:hypothetical protein